ncbi:MAG: hypothetical protein JXC32_12755, partial [Anaerolineae bacterium]|nr:hypothetical protein [Anaerolineae bacterium]
MRVTLEPAWQVPEAATFFRNVWPMYLHDLSQYALDFFRLDNLGLWQPDIVDDWVAPVTRTDLLREARSPRDPGHPFQRAHVISAGGCRSGFVCVGLAP